MYRLIVVRRSGYGLHHGLLCDDLLVDTLSHGLSSCGCEHGEEVALTLKAGTTLGLGLGTCHLLKLNLWRLLWSIAHGLVGRNIL